MKFTSMFSGFWGGISKALASVFGKQSTGPVSSLVDDLPGVSVDKALQLSAVWACVERIAKTIASLPLFVYEERGNGLRELWESEECWTYVESLRAPDAVVFLVQPHASRVSADAHRPAADADARVILRIDGMVQLLFELAGIPYIPIGSDTVQQRQRQIARTLELAGLRSVA
jgi:hypothetical protein